MYEITDNYGTRQIAWRWKTALEWLAACGEDATIVHRLTGAFLAGRLQSC